MVLRRSVGEFEDAVERDPSVGVMSVRVAAILLLFGALALAGCSSTPNDHETAVVTPFPPVAGCQSNGTTGVFRPPAFSSSTVVIHLSAVDHAFNPFEVSEAYGRCLPGFTSGPGIATYNVAVGTTQAELRALIAALRKTGKFASVQESS